MKSRTWMILSLVIICGLAAFALAEVSAMTMPRILENRVEGTRSGLSRVLPQGASFKEIEKDSLWYGLDAAGTKVGIVIRTGRRGYGGPVPVLVGLDLTGRIIGIKLASPAEGLKETPGLGLKATQPWFTSQFVGLDSTLKLKREGGTVDAIAGATITSRAVARGIAEGIRKYASHLKP